MELIYFLMNQMILITWSGLSSANCALRIREAYCARECGVSAERPRYCGYAAYEPVPCARCVNYRS